MRDDLEVMDIREQFSNSLRRLEGLQCWGVTAGEGSGSHVSLDFGNKIERARPLRNRHLAEAVRKFKGEFGIFVQGCAWRLDAEKMICSSKTPNANDGPMALGLRTLVDQRVVNATPTLSGYDLLIEFSAGATLRLFCDCFDDVSDGDNYSFHTPDWIFVVKAGGILTRESRRHESYNQSGLRL